MGPLAGMAATDLLAVFGTLASVIGAVLTVYYARGAKSASQAAEAAAKRMRMNLTKLDYISVISSIRQELSELKRNLIDENYLRANQICVHINSMIISISNSDDDGAIAGWNTLLSKMRGDLHDLAGKCIKVSENSIKKFSPSVKSTAIVQIDRYMGQIDELYAGLKKTMEARDA